MAKKKKSVRRRNPASLLVTVNNKTGVRRYYINSRRVTKAKFDAAKHGRRLDTFHTVTRGKITRHYSEVRNKKR